MHARIRKIRLMTRMRRLTRISVFARSERGVQLAELAIVLPIFMVLFAATAEFGRFFYEYTTLAKASRLGARYLITAPVNCASATEAKKLVVYGNIAGTGSPVIEGLMTSNVTITPNDSACPPTSSTLGVPETVTVQITGFKHRPLFDLGGLMNNATFSLNIDVKPSVTMRYLLTTPLI